MKYQKEFIEAALKDSAYDYIAANYCSMKKEDLKDIILELIWALDYDEDYIDNLKELWGME